MVHRTWLTKLFPFRRRRGRVANGGGCGAAAAASQTSPTWTLSFAVRRGVPFATGTRRTRIGWNGKRAPIPVGVLSSPTTLQTHSRRPPVSIDPSPRPETAAQRNWGHCGGARDRGEAAGGGADQRARSKTHVGHRVFIPFGGLQAHWDVSDHLKSSFLELSPEASNIIRAEGANHPSDHR